MTGEEIKKKLDESAMLTPQEILDKIDKDLEASRGKMLQQLQPLIREISLEVLARVHDLLMKEMQDMCYQYQQGVSAENIADEFMVKLGLRRE